MKLSHLPEAGTHDQRWNAALHGPTTFGLASHRGSADTLLCYQNSTQLSMITAGCLVPNELLVGNNCGCKCLKRSACKLRGPLHLVSLRYVLFGPHNPHAQVERLGRALCTCMVY